VLIRFEDGATVVSVSAGYRLVDPAGVTIEDFRSLPALHAFLDRRPDLGDHRSDKESDPDCNIN
jgi:hypothetical protein